MGSSTRWIRRCAAVLVAVVLVSGSGTAALAAAAPAPGPVGVAAKGAFLFDDTANKSKWSRGADVQLPIASITKVMTALVVLQKGKLDRTFTVKQKYIDYSVRHDGSLAGLVAGDKLTVRQLLYGLMLPSGCDAAYMLADIYGPTWQKFVAAMNKTAKKLGMKKTVFANFDGLPWPSATSTRSTPRDLMRLAHKAFKYPVFRKIVATKNYTLAKTKTRHAYKMTNTNRLIGVYGGMSGIKTGTTLAAGFCLLFAAKRGKKTLIGVVLNSSSTNEQARFTDATKILDWGFGVKTATLKAVPPVPAGANVG